MTELLFWIRYRWMYSQLNNTVHQIPEPNYIHSWDDGLFPYYHSKCSPLNLFQKFNIWSFLLWMSPVSICWKKKTNWYDCLNFINKYFHQAFKANFALKKIKKAKVSVKFKFCWNARSNMSRDHVDIKQLHVSVVLTSSVKQKIVYACLHKRRHILLADGQFHHRKSLLFIRIILNKLETHGWYRWFI